MRRVSLSKDNDRYDETINGSRARALNDTCLYATSDSREGICDEGPLATARRA